MTEKLTGGRKLGNIYQRRLVLARLRVVHKYGDTEAGEMRSTRRSTLIGMCVCVCVCVVRHNIRRPQEPDSRWRDWKLAESTNVRQWQTHKFKVGVYQEHALN